MCWLHHIRQLVDWYSVIIVGPPHYGVFSHLSKVFKKARNVPKQPIRKRFRILLHLGCCSRDIAQSNVVKHKGFGISVKMDSMDPDNAAVGNCSKEDYFSVTEFNGKKHFRCVICGRYLTSKRSILLHLHSAHQDRRSFPMSFSDKLSLVKFLNSVICVNNYSPKIW